MDPLRVIAETRGLFARTDALAVGHDDNSIANALRCGIWVRIRRGTYTFTDLWASADATGQHTLRARSVAQRLGDRVALSHTSAALFHGLDVWGVPLDDVHVTRLDGVSGRTEAGVVHHEGFCVQDDVVRVNGVLVTRPARAAIETATLGNVESGVVVLDSVLRQGCSREDLEETYAIVKHWPATRGLQVSMRLADGRAESVGETRSRHLCWTHRLPAPELQFRVYDAQGRLVGITDFAWPQHGLLGEFDGRIKYGRLLRPGETAADAVFREKLREDALRESTRWGMIRFVWDDLNRSVATVARLRRMLRVTA